VVRRFPAALTCVAALLAAGLSVVPGAAAAEGDVLTAHWQSGDKAGSHVVTPAVTSTSAGGASFVNGYASKITVTPPTGARFEAGQTYAAAATRTESLAGIGQHGYSTCSSSLWTGTIVVHGSSYDGDGRLSSLAASYVAECATSGRTDQVAGDVRMADATPYGALIGSYASQPVAIGHERATTATLTATGDVPMELGSASVVGTDRTDYRVTANACAGVTLADGSSCRVTVAFAPQEKANGSSGSRRARLVVGTPGSLGGSVSVALSSTAVRVPGKPEALTTYPVTDGVGITWLDGWPSPTTYLLERRLRPTDGWEEVAEVAAASPQRKSYVDRDVVPGQGVEYRVTADTSGWTGEPATAEVTRRATNPTPGPSSVLAVGSTTAAEDRPPLVLSNTDADTTVIARGGTWPEIQAERSSVRQTFAAPIVAGPGLYRAGSGSHLGSLSGYRSELNCGPFVESVLRVREVLFADDLTPLVYDASWTGLCTDGTVARAEIRLGSDRDHTFTTSAPESVGLLTTHGGTPVSQKVTLGNRGPVDVDLGAATVAGAAATDWATTQDSCSGTTLGAGATCSITVSFATTAAGTRDARLEVPLATPDGPLAPHLVMLRGRGADVPKPVWGLQAHGMLAGVRISWTKPTDDGGYPVDGYDVQRRPLGTTGSWTTLGTTQDVKLYDATADDTSSFDYRVRAVNKVGGSTWTTRSASLATTGVVVDAETGTDKPRALHLVSAVNGSPPAVPMSGTVTHDHADPAVSSGGSKLVYSRSTNAGLGEDGEYDLWLSTIANTFGPTQATPTRLTDMGGAELDAAVSPDASTVAFTHVDASGPSVWVMPIAGGPPVRLAVQAADPAWLPAGEALVVEDTTGGMLRVVPVDGGAPTVRDGTQGATDPVVSRDGALAFVDRDGNLAEIAEGASVPTVRRAATSSQRFRDPAYSADGSLLVTYTTNVGTGLKDVTNSDRGLSGGLRHVGQAAPAIRDVHQPSVSIEKITDTAVRGSQKVEFTYRDGLWPEETPHAMLRVDCGLDGVWSPCSSPLRLENLTDGKHVLKVRVRDEVGRTGVASTRFVSDTSAPSVQITAPRGIAGLDSPVTFRWRGEDPHSAITSYDMAWRKAGLSGPFSRWRKRSQVTGTSHALKLSQGQEACLRVRARNRTGLTSGWRTRCIGRPFDDSVLGANARWRYVYSKPALNRTLSEATTPGATLTSRTVTGRRVAVLAQTCRGCGAVKVYLGKRYVGQVSTASPRTRSRVWLELPVLRREHTGPVRLVTTSRAPVRIDGLLVRRTR
jgi:hypothetical protein